jgi:HEPN domain-containing protein
MVRFERTHSLTLLLDLCKSQAQDFEKLRSELEQLENYSIAVRYPGVKISVELAEEAFELVTKVRQFVRTKLGLK